MALLQASPGAMRPTQWTAFGRQAYALPLRRHPSRQPLGTSVLLHIFLDREFLVGEAAKDGAMIVDGEAFRNAERRVRWHDGGHLAVLGAADPNALLEPGIGLMIRS